jgi:hypothetical protein
MAASSAVRRERVRDFRAALRVRQQVAMQGLVIA